MQDKYILALDQGTTASRAMLFHHNGEIRQSAQKECPQYYPKPGWVEQNPDVIWSSQYAVLSEVMARTNISTSDIAAIGITNQRETVIVWDKVRNLPEYPAIGWQDRRTVDYCEQLITQGAVPMIRERTGLLIDACFSATKIKWILDNVPGARTRAENGELLFFTVDSYLIWKLTGGKLHITDSSNASRTMLFNIHTGQWDSTLLRLFGIPITMMPEVRSSSEVYGATAIMAPGSSGMPIAGIAADQQAALFGQNCIDPGMVNNTYGIDCRLMMHTGIQPILSKNRLNTSIAWTREGCTEYALQGTIGGAVVQWLRDGLNIIQKLEDLEQVGNLEYAEDIYIVPGLSGLGAPYWIPHARGTIFGITPETTRGHIAFAVLESIAYQTCDMLKAMEADTGVTIKELHVDGPASFNGLLMQIQSNILGLYVVKPKVAETGALGAAYFAGLAVGFWSSLEEIRQYWRRDRNFRPHISREQAEERIMKWRRAVKAALAWTQA